mgnify:CR=1 FL=1
MKRDSFPSKIFTEFPEVKEHYGKRFRYIMVDEYQVHEARAAGADAVLVKPVPPSALLAAINKLFAV